MLTIFLLGYKTASRILSQKYVALGQQFSIKWCLKTRRRNMSTRGAEFATCVKTKRWVFLYFGPYIIIMENKVMDYNAGIMWAIREFWSISSSVWIISNPTWATYRPFYFFKPTEDESDILKEEIRSLQVSFQKLILSFSYKNNK